MLEGLLVVERLVLESLEIEAKSLESLVQDTGISKAILDNSLAMLSMRNVIIVKDGKFSLNKETQAQWREVVTREESIKDELKDMFTAIVNKHFENKIVESKTEESSLKFRKIWMNDSDKKILNALMYQVESFITSVEKTNKEDKSKKLSDKDVVFWGTSGYQSLIDSVLQIA